MSEQEDDPLLQKNRELESRVRELESKLQRHEVVSEVASKGARSALRLILGSNVERDGSRLVQSAGSFVQGDYSLDLMVQDLVSFLVSLGSRAVRNRVLIWVLGAVLAVMQVKLLYSQNGIMRQQLELGSSQDRIMRQQLRLETSVRIDQIETRIQRVSLTRDALRSAGSRLAFVAKSNLESRGKYEPSEQGARLMLEHAGSRAQDVLPRVVDDCLVRVSMVEALSSVLHASRTSTAAAVSLALGAGDIVNTMDKTCLERSQEQRSRAKALSRNLAP